MAMVAQSIDWIGKTIYLKRLFPAYTRSTIFGDFHQAIPQEFPFNSNNLIAFH